MELRTLRAFVEVVRQGGFSPAARSIFLTQSAISKAVKQLEDELGLQLLDRVGHRSNLTDAGHIVYRRALAMLAEREDMLGELGELRGLRRGTLRLGFPPIGSDALFAPIFARFRARFPGIDIELVEHGSRRLEEMVLAGELDIGASLLPLAEGFDWQEVRCEPIDVLISAGHRLAAAPALSMAGLRQEPFILFDTGFALNPLILDVCRQAGFEPVVTARSSQIHFIVELVAAGVGIGFLPRLIAEKRVRPGVRHIAIVDPGMVWNMALIWRRGAYLSQAARAWLALAAEPMDGSTGST